MHARSSPLRRLTMAGTATQEERMERMYGPNWRDKNRRMPHYESQEYMVGRVKHSGPFRSVYKREDKCFSYVPSIHDPIDYLA